MKGSDFLNFFNILWSLCSNRFYMYCRNWGMREVKKSRLFEPSFTLCFMEQREQSPLLFFKGMNILEKVLQRKS